MAIFRNIISPRNIRVGKQLKLPEIQGVSYDSQYGWLLTDETTNYNVSITNEDWLVMRETLNTGLYVEYQSVIYFFPIEFLQNSYTNMTNVNTINSGVGLLYHTEASGSNLIGGDYSIITLYTPQRNYKQIYDGNGSIRALYPELPIDLYYDKLWVK